MGRRVVGDRGHGRGAGCAAHLARRSTGACRHAVAGAGQGWLPPGHGLDRQGHPESGALRHPCELVRGAGGRRGRIVHRGAHRPDRRRRRRLDRQPADADHRRVLVTARTRAGDRCGRRARPELRSHADRGVDRVVAVLRETRSGGSGPARGPSTHRGRQARESARFDWPAVICCPARCPTPWWPPASTSAP
jgi:hypothetical protein